MTDAPSPATPNVRILFVHQTGEIGGAGLTLASVLSSLDNPGYERLVLSPAGDLAGLFASKGATVLQSPRPIHQFTHISGYARHAWHPRFALDRWNAWRSRRFWEQYLANVRPDIVHLNAITLLPMAEVARASGAKIVFWIQETAVRGAVGLRTAWMRRAVERSADAVVYISEYDRRAWGVHVPIVEVIPNWVDFNAFDRSVSGGAPRELLGIPPQAKVVLFLGGVSALKGTLPLLQALDRLADLDRVVLVIAGWRPPPELNTLSPLQRALRRGRRLLGTDYRLQVERFIEQHGLRSRLRVVELRPDVVPLYAAADIVVFPATAPHQARPVVEAGAMAKPIVISQFPNVGEFVHDGVTGLMTKAGDPGSLALALRRLIEDPQLAAQMGEAHYAHTVATNRPSESRGRIAGLYARLAASRRAGGLAQVGQ